MIKTISCEIMKNFNYWIPIISSTHRRRIKWRVFRSWTWCTSTHKSRKQGVGFQRNRRGNTHHPSDFIKRKYPQTAVWKSDNHHGVIQWDWGRGNDNLTGSFTQLGRKTQFTTLDKGEFGMWLGKNWVDRQGNWLLLKDGSRGWGLRGWRGFSFLTSLAVALTSFQGQLGEGSSHRRGWSWRAWRGLREEKTSA